MYTHAQPWAHAHTLFIVKQNWGHGGLHMEATTSQQSAAYRDALIAKQRTITLLDAALRNISSVAVDVILAVVLLFIEFELIDSGRDGWKYHVKGARALIERLCGRDVSKKADMSAMRSFSPPKASSAD